MAQGGFYFASKTSHKGDLTHEKHGKDHGQDRGPVQNRGFIFAGSEIYGGLANTWDYGPLGVELKTT